MATNISFDFKTPIRKLKEDLEASREEFNQKFEQITKYCEDNDIEFELELIIGDESKIFTALNSEVLKVGTLLVKTEDTL